MNHKELMQLEHDRKLEADFKEYCALGRRKDLVWDLCKKYIEANGIINNDIARIVGQNPADPRRAADFLASICNVVGYASIESLLALEDVKVAE